MYGDVLVELNGNDILGLSKEAVINVIKVYNREPLRIKVARVRPIPIMSDDRKELIQVLRSKVSCSGEYVRELLDVSLRAGNIYSI